jgi:hypothetical protein
MIRGYDPLAKLLARVRAATKIRGKRAELARFLRVPRQQVNTWLAGISSPGGKVALLMLQWVGRSEGKTKSRGGALTPPRRKTRNKTYDSKITGPKRR